MYFLEIEHKRLNSGVEFTDNQSVICPAVCTTHSLCHSEGQVEKRNQKEISTPNTEVGKTKLTIRYLYLERSYVAPF